MDPTPSTITVRLDDRLQVLPAGSTLADLVALLGHEPQAVTTAVDGRFVPRAQRAAQPLQDQQRVLLFQPIVGG
jgi:sulfur carrier protein